VDDRYCENLRALHEQDNLQNAMLCEAYKQRCRAFLERVDPRIGYLSKANQISQAHTTFAEQIRC